MTRKGGRTKRHGIKFFKETLLFCRIQDRTSSLEAIPSDEGSNMNFDERDRVGPKRTKQPPPHDVQESQIPLAGGFTPSYEVNEASTASQEGLFSYPSIYAEQTTLSDSANIERKGSSGPINFYNTPYSSLDNENYFESVYLSQPYAEPTNSSYLLPHDDGFVRQWVWVYVGSKMYRRNDRSSIRMVCSQPFVLGGVWYIVFMCLIFVRCYVIYLLVCYY